MAQASAVRWITGSDADPANFPVEGQEVLTWLETEGYDRCVLLAATWTPTAQEVLLPIVQSGFETWLVVNDSRLIPDLPYDEIRCLLHLRRAGALVVSLGQLQTILATHRRPTALLVLACGLNEQARPLLQQQCEQLTPLLTAI